MSVGRLTKIATAQITSGTNDLIIKFEKHFRQFYRLKCPTQNNSISITKQLVKVRRASMIEFMAADDNYVFVTDLHNLCQQPTFEEAVTTCIENTTS